MNTTAEQKCRPGRARLDELGFTLIDADNHYYEPHDAFTRYMEPVWRDRGFRWFTNEAGQRRLLIGDRLLRMIIDPTFERVAKPGALLEVFRNHGSSDFAIAGREVEPIRPEYRDRSARLAAMDRQGVERVWLFPTLGVVAEKLMNGDPAFIWASYRAFNRWLDEDWGFNHVDRIYAVPLFSLASVDAAVHELEWVLSRGARIIHLRPAPVPGLAHGRSLADRAFDPFWARVNEAGIAVTFHAGDSGYFESQSVDWGEMPNPPTHLISNLQVVTCSYRPIFDTLAALVLHGLFERFPRIRVVSVELGCHWVPFLLKSLGHVKRRRDWVGLKGDPIEYFRRHVWVEPFAEENVAALVDCIGADRVVIGSDFPHVEGTTEPAAFLEEIGTLSPGVLQRIMRENALELMSDPA
jgi:predicted TIM-barrel fold metal-dependent hydrolase